MMAMAKAGESQTIRYLQRSIVDENCVRND